MRKPQPAPSTCPSSPSQTASQDDRRRRHSTFLNNIPLWSSKIPIASASTDTLEQDIHPYYRRKGSRSCSHAASISSTGSDTAPEVLAVTNVSCDYLVDTLPQGEGFDETLDRRYRERISQHRVSLPQVSEEVESKPHRKIKMYAPPRIPRRSSSRRHLSDSIDERLARYSIDTPSLTTSPGPWSASTRSRQTPATLSPPSSPGYSRFSFASTQSAGPAKNQGVPAMYPGIPEDPELYADPRVSALSPYHRVLNQAEDGKLHMNVSYAEAQMLLSVRKRRLALQEEETPNGWVHALEDELKELQDTFGIPRHSGPKSPDISGFGSESRSRHGHQDSRSHSDPDDLEPIYDDRFEPGRAT